eukprot:1159855-Rhodomonas_salina.1
MSKQTKVASAPPPPRPRTSLPCVRAQPSHASRPALGPRLIVHAFCCIPPRVCLLFSVLGRKRAALGSRTPATRLQVAQRIRPPTFLPSIPLCCVAKALSMLTRFRFACGTAGSRIKRRKNDEKAEDDGR